MRKDLIQKRFLFCINTMLKLIQKLVYIDVFVVYLLIFLGLNFQMRSCFMSNVIIHLNVMELTNVIFHVSVKICLLHKTSLFYDLPL